MTNAELTAEDNSACRISLVSSRTLYELPTHRGQTQCSGPGRTPLQSSYCARPPPVVLVKLCTGPVCDG